MLFSAGLSAPAAVIFNTPDAASGFFDGMSDYFNYDGTGQIAGVSSTALPDANGLSSQKVWGSAQMAAGQFDPYIVLVAWGTASGAFTVDTQIALQYDFHIISQGESDVFYYVQAEIETAEGYYTTEYSSSGKGAISGNTSILNTNTSEIIAAGVAIEGWGISIGVGNFGSCCFTGDVEVQIPANSVKFLATANGQLPAPPPPPSSETPEPSTIGFTGIGLALLLARRLRHPV